MSEKNAKIVQLEHQLAMTRVVATKALKTMEPPQMTASLMTLSSEQLTQASMQSLPATGQEEQDPLPSTPSQPFSVRSPLTNSQYRGLAHGLAQGLAQGLAHGLAQGPKGPMGPWAQDT